MSSRYYEFSIRRNQQTIYSHPIYIKRPHLGHTFFDVSLTLHGNTSRIYKLHRHVDIFNHNRLLKEPLPSHQNSTKEERRKKKEERRKKKEERRKKK